MTKLRVMLIPSNSGEASPLFWETLRFTQGDGFSNQSMVVKRRVPHLNYVYHDAIPNFGTSGG